METKDMEEVMDMEAVVVVTAVGAIAILVMVQSKIKRRTKVQNPMIMATMWDTLETIQVITNQTLTNIKMLRIKNLLVTTTRSKMKMKGNLKFRLMPKNLLGQKHLNCQNLDKRNKL